MKSPRIYEELAVCARARGYPKVTAAAIHDWRKRGLLPPVRGVTRRAHLPEELPEPLVASVLAVCRYRYDEDVRDLPIVGLLMWLDGHPVPDGAVRTGLSAIESLPSRLVASAGSRARAAYVDDANADVEAAAEALSHQSELFESISGTSAVRDIWAGANDALMVALGRMAAPAADPEALTDLAVAMGFDRATREGFGDAGPWLTGDGGQALLKAISNLFGRESRGDIQALGEPQLDEIREISLRVIRILAIFAETLALGYARGTGGFGFLVVARQTPWMMRALTTYAVAKNPGNARRFVDAIPEETLREVASAVELARIFISNHPELADRISAVGLVQVLEETPAASDN